MKGDYCAITGTVTAMSAKAVLFRDDESGSLVWVPMSQIFEDDLAGLAVGVVGEINITEWFYNKEF